MFTTRPELEGTFGMVASTHWLASQSGMAVLERGGNAFDAAVAAGFVLQVVEPHLNGPGGEVPIVAYVAGDDKTTVICGQGVSPAAATLGAFTDLDLTLIPGTGLLPAVVPGAFDGWMTLLQRYGTMRVRDVLDYAIGYAERGFPVLPAVAATVSRVADMLAAEWPTSAALWLAGGRPPQANTLMRNPALAATYRRIVAEAEAASAERDAQIDAARDAYYRGFVADAIDGFVRRTSVVDSSGRRHGGLLTGADMAAWGATEESPLTYDYRASGRTYTVVKSPAWSQAPVFLQQLAILAGIDLDATEPNSPDFIHTVVEASKLAFADREAFYGDPAFADVPIAALLSDEYNAERRTLVGDRADVGPLRPGSPDGRRPVLPDYERLIGVASAPSGGEPTMQSAKDAATRGAATRDAATRGAVASRSAAAPPARDTGLPSVGADGQTRGDTCHLDVVDRFGNMVSATPSGGWLQSSPTIPELGFCLTTRGQMFWLQEGLPNSLAPGKRPRTTLTPTLALRDGAPYLAFGTPGGDQQDQWSLQFFLRHVHHGLNLQQAIEQVAFHSAHMPESFYPRGRHPGRLHIEGRAEATLLRELRARGHDIDVADDWSLGRIAAVSRSGDGILRAAANPRGMQGYAVGR